MKNRLPFAGLNVIKLPPAALCAALAVLPGLFAQNAVSAPPGYALVIGNAAYTGVDRLPNPVNDATDVAAALRSLGFTVELLTNTGLSGMENAVTRLRDRLAGNRGAYGFFYYAGHAVQVDGVNYLIPVGANIPSESYLRERAFPLQAMMRELNAARNGLNIIVLDACRDNPFEWSRNRRFGGSTRGLAVETLRPSESLVVYAAAEGMGSADGTGRNGVYTGELLKHLRTPGLEVREIFRRTRSGVIQVSGGSQRPALYDEFSGHAYLAPAPDTAAATAPAPPPAPASMPAVITQPAPGGGALDMVWIQGGTFTMGSPAGEAGRYDHEGPQHQVTVSSFYLGKYEVTQADYEAVTGTNPSHFRGADLPVENVSWFDAVEYCNRRSQREGLSPAYTVSGSGDSRSVTWNREAGGYRLPTEAEWEYACRAGTTTPYHSGASADSAAWHSGNSGNATHPVGQKQPNAWGLHDMHGNVYEWCQDRYGIYSGGAQTDPAGASSFADRVNRGGSWSHSARYVRSACRNFLAPAYRFNDLGFRLLRPGLPARAGHAALPVPSGPP